MGSIALLVSSKGRIGRAAFWLGWLMLMGVVGLADMDDTATAMAILGGLGGMLLVVMFSLLVALAFLIWQGVGNGDPGANRYGPPPVGPGAAWIGAIAQASA